MAFNKYQFVLTYDQYITLIRGLAFIQGFRQRDGNAMEEAFNLLEMLVSIEPARVEE